MTCILVALGTLQTLVNPLKMLRMKYHVPPRKTSSVGVATHYGLDGPRIESRWGGGEGFPHSSRPALGPTQPPII